MPSRFPLLQLLRRFPGFVGLVALLLACVTTGPIVQLANVAQHPGFDAHVLGRGGVALLGFEGETPDLPAAERDRFDYPLNRTWNAEPGGGRLLSLPESSALFRERTRP